MVTQKEAAAILLEQAIRDGDQEQITMYSDLVTLWEQQIELFDPDGALQIALDHAKEPGKQAVADFFNQVLDSSTIFGTKTWSTLLHDMEFGNWTSDSTVSEISEGLTNMLNAAIAEAAGIDNQTLLDAQKLFGFTNWELLSSDVQLQLFQTFSEAVGSEKAREAFNAIGYDIDKAIVDAVATGVYSAVLAAMGNSEGGDTKPIIINLDGEKIYENQQKIARNRGYNMGMGAFSFG